MSIDVKAFGAKGDGITDDTQAFQKAIDTASAKGGDRVFVPAGVYRIKRVFLKSNITLSGEGYASKLKLVTPAKEWDMVLIAGEQFPADNITIQSLSIDGSRVELGLSDIQMHGIDLRDGARDITIFNVIFENICGDGIRTAQEGTLQPHLPTNITIQQCVFYNCGRQDIALVQGENLSVVGCQGTGQLDVEGNPGDKYTVHHVSISACNFKYFALTTRDLSNKSYMSVTNSTFEFAEIWEVRGVAFAGNTVRALRVSDGIDVTISGNHLRQLELWGLSESYGEGVVVTGNVISNVTTPKETTLSTYKSGEHHAIVIWHHRKYIITGNIITAETKGIKIHEESDNGVIEGNKITLVRTANTPPNDLNQSSNCGIEISNRSLQIIITNNDINHFFKGIHVDGSTYPDKLIIRENTIYGAGLRGIDLNYCTGSIVEDNVLHGNSGIMLEGGSAYVRHNSIVGNTVGKLYTFSGMSKIVVDNNHASMPNDMYFFESTAVSNISVPPILALPSLPQASVNQRGQLVRIEGAAGKEDAIYICKKLANGTYTWVKIG